MKQVLRIFLGAKGTHPVLVLSCLLLAAMCEAVGIGTLLPAVTLISGSGNEGPKTGVDIYVSSLFAWAGVAPTLGNLIVLIVAAIVLKSLISFGALTYAGLSAARVSVDMRRKLLDAVFGASWRFYSSQHGGSFANAVSNDATRAGDAYLNAAQFSALAIQSAIFLAVALAVNWRLALSGLAAGAIIALALSGLIRMTKKAGYKQTDRTRQLTVLVVDLLANIKPLKTMHRYGDMKESLTATMRRLQRTLNVREWSKQGLSQGGDALTAIAIGLVLYVSSAFWQVPLPQLVVGGVIFMRVIQNVTKLQRLMQQMVQVESAYERLGGLIDTVEQNREVHNGTKVPSPRSDCRFIDVSFSYGNAPVLKSVDMEFPAGGITVLQGPSGAGKTTIIDLLIGLHMPSSGQILIGDDPLPSLDIAKFRRRIGYVPQELTLLHSTVRENITLGDKSIGDAKVMAALELAGAADFIASLPQGLDTDVGETGGKLSGGQRQRISLARALVTGPEFLILDEVTSALDPQTEAEIVKNIAELHKRFTIIIITHREAWAAIADRLYDVAGGEVSEAAPAPNMAAVRA
jgi:ATP-binding cassette subfamily C protein